MNKFLLEVITPEKLFLKKMVEAVVCEGLDGQFCVEKGHQMMVAALKVGEIRFRIDGQWKSAFNSEAFMEVRPDEVIVFSQSCEWPEDIDAARAEQAKERALQKLMHQESIRDHRHTEISLARAMARLKLKNDMKNI